MVREWRRGVVRGLFVYLPRYLPACATRLRQRLSERIGEGSAVVGGGRQVRSRLRAVKLVASARENLHSTSMLAKALLFTILGRVSTFMVFTPGNSQCVHTAVASGRIARHRCLPSMPMTVLPAAPADQSRVYLFVTFCRERCVVLLSDNAKFIFGHETRGGIAATGQHRAITVALYAEGHVVIQPRFGNMART